MGGGPFLGTSTLNPVTVPTCSSDSILRIRLNQSALLVKAIELGFELSWVNQCFECNASSDAVAASLVRAETSCWPPAVDRRVGFVNPSPPRYLRRGLFLCPSPPPKHQQQLLLRTPTPSRFASAHPRSDRPPKTVFVSQNVSFPPCRRVHWLDLRPPRPGGAACQCQARPL